MKDTKRRQPFIGYAKSPLTGDDIRVVSGVLYDEGNIQVLWRLDIGYTGQQFCSIAFVFGMKICGGKVYKVEVE